MAYTKLPVTSPELEELLELDELEDELDELEDELDDELELLLDDPSCGAG